MEHFVGHEVIVYGCIQGAQGRREKDLDPLQLWNAPVIAELPEEGEWPWLVRGMFALPAPWPQGTYQSQLIHFGASLKDEPGDRAVWEQWLQKFEALLRNLYWFSAVVHLETEFEPDRVYRWTPSAAAMQRLYVDSPQCVWEWNRSMHVLREQID